MYWYEWIEAVVLHCRLESSKTLLSEAQSIEDLVTSYERQLSQLANLSADSATLKQTREQLQVRLVWLTLVIS